jgi:pimeloyl-ACP methyl ester carboxylesterase
MSGNRTAGSSLVTAAEWFAGGGRILYDPESARVVTEEDAAATPGGVRVFERVAAAEQDDDTVWLTLLPGFPDGSYGWAQVDRMLGDGLGPRLYVEPVGQGNSDKPRDYRYSTVERADLVAALWRHHGVRRRVVVAFDYTAMALLELLRRQLDTTIATPAITAALMVKGGLFADAHTHPWWTTPVLPQAEPHAEILVNRTSHNVIARPATPTEDDILWAQFARLNPGYDEYRQLTERRIPVIILEPRVQNDAAGHDHST